MSDRRRKRQRPRPEAKTSLKRTLVGKVVSDKRAKTVTVLVERRVKHELYGKIVAQARASTTRTTRRASTSIGDMVEIAESRPISKTKSWVVTRLVAEGRAV